MFEKFTSHFTGKVAGLHLTGRTAKYLTQPPTNATYQTLIPGLEKLVESLDPKQRFDDLNY